MKITKSTFSCEQLYEIWSSEPELLSIIDLRDSLSFEMTHIPGSMNLKIQDLNEHLSHLGDRLAVIIANDSVKAQVKKNLQYTHFDNFLFLKECQRWKELKMPLLENSIIDINTKIKHQGISMNNGTFMFQLFEPESSTYTYIIGDEMTKEAAIIDPVMETLDRDLKFLEELGLNLLYILDTHVHADHITAAAEIRKITKAKTAVSALSGVECVDLLLEDAQELKLGNKTIKAIATPGHTNSCMSFYFEGRAFTGDTLLIRGSGRTDFQQGSPEKLYHSVHQKLFQLPDSTLVYPAHDYRGFTSSTIALEKKFNPRLGVHKSLEDLKKIMSELKLPYPKKIDISLPANLKCGIIKETRALRPQIVDSIPEVTCDDVLKHSSRIRLIDVRRPEEFNGELGHIEGAELVTLGEELTHFLAQADINQEIAFICRSGGRSSQATAESIRQGFTKTVNMAGGMLLWNEKKLPIKKTS
jgi:glyoxylase-like metal-dependent hydrolase (beta-lactamase superfamily II)/rhodanese-related sulfurtransferase